MKAILFDFDGTLIDSAPDLAHAANRLMQSMSLPEFPVETIAGFIGNGIPRLVERVMIARNLPMDNHQEITEQFIALYKEDPTSRTIIFPHVPETLSALKSAKILLGLCTNKSEAATKIILDNLQLAQFFDVVIGGDSTKAMKPDPLPLLTALQSLDTAPDEAVFIGDSQVDMMAAKNAAMRFWFYEGGYCHINPEEIRADWRFSSFPQLCKKIL